jgi:carboxymethylenebutenolidase
MAGAAPGERLELTSGDGTPFAAFLSLPPDTGATAVVVLPDVRGLYPFYEELAERLAAAGHPAIALDYFGRTAGLGARGDDFDYMPHVDRTTIETVQLDLAAARDALLAHTGDVAVATVGFCFGGTMSFHAATNPELGLAGVVGFYGGLSRKRFGVSPTDRVGDVAGTRVLGLFGGDDPGIPPEEVEAFEAALVAAGVDHEVVVYPGAPHSFFDRKQTEFADASQDAWRRTLGFLGALSA